MNTTRSLLAAISVLATASSFGQYQLNPLWTLNPGSRTYISSGDSQRGIAYNPATDNVLIVNRNSGLSVNSVAGSSGANVGTLNLTGISGGTLALNLIGVGTDGSIFAVNQSNNSADTNTPVNVYRWANEAAVPEKIFSGDISGNDANANNRIIGDSFAVRGSGANTQILLGSRGTTAYVLTTTDGTTFTAKKITTDVPSGGLTRSVDFGSGNEIWVTTSSQPVRVLTLDINAGTAVTTRSYTGTTIPTSVSILGIDDNADFLGAINMNSTPTHDAVILYPILGGTPVAHATNSIAADNSNSNASGEVDFGNGRMYVLDSNNGLTTYTIAVPEPTTFALGALGLGALALAARRKR
jgi:hypothetical protein